MQNLLTLSITSNPPFSFCWIIRPQTSCFQAVSRICTAALRTAAAGRESLTSETLCNTTKGLWRVTKLLYTDLKHADWSSDWVKYLMNRPLHRNYFFSFLFHIMSMQMCTWFIIRVLYFTLTGFDVFFPYIQLYLICSLNINFGNTVNKPCCDPLMMNKRIKILLPVETVFCLFKPLYDNNNEWMETWNILLFRRCCHNGDLLVINTFECFSLCNMKY